MNSQNNLFGNNNFGVLFICQANVVTKTFQDFLS